MSAPDATEYLKTHGQSLQRALIMALRAAPEATFDTDDKRYWRHELQALQACLEELP